MDLLKLIESLLLNNDDSNVYKTIRSMFGRLDYEVAYFVDHFRRLHTKAQRLTDLETELSAKITTLRELSLTVSDEHEAKLQEQVVQLQWMLNQIRGTGSMSRSYTEQSNHGTNRRDEPVATRSPTARGTKFMEEVPIE